MASATFPFPMLLAPLQMFAAWLVRPITPAPGVPAARSAQPQRASHAAVRAASVVRPAARQCRVVRVYGGPSRMVISGRMADVCAELDRLAALEATGR